jgi:S-adenosylmethionine decarboxylase
MNSELDPRNTQSAAADTQPQAWPEADNGKDYYVTRNGVKYAGTHLLIDLWGATKLDDIDLVETALRNPPRRR